jgi:multiple sugar transport system ATP-binding protein
MASLELTGISKSYGDNVAVADIDLQIEDNEFFCIFGPPSCGKTTILRLLLGLVAPDSGEIRIGGELVTQLPPKDRNLAMVFQNLALFPHMTTKQNLAFPLAERKMDKQEIEARIAKVADVLHITPLLKKLPAHLSGGERQRVAIGRALVRDPGAFLMDEPIAALDARLREEMRVELKRLQREQNHTLVYVTHDQEEAMSVADRMAIFEAGRIRQIGTPAEIYNQPNSRYVAELIGSPPMNFIDGTVSGGSFSASDVGMMVPFDAVDFEGAACLAIRPEDIEIRGADQPGIDAKVYEVEPLGAFTIVDIVIGEKIVKVQVSGQPEFELGSPVRLAIEPRHCHLFDGESGDVIVNAR